MPAIDDFLNGLLDNDGAFGDDWTVLMLSSLLLNDLK